MFIFCLQRHFCVFALSFPGKESVKTIYSSIFTQHLKINSFAMAVQKQALQLVDCAIALHNRVTQVFLPTAVKFHYVFNLRDLSNIFQVKYYSLINDLFDTQFPVVNIAKLYRSNVGLLGITNRHRNLSPILF